MGEIGVGVMSKWEGTHIINLARDELTGCEPVNIVYKGVGRQSIIYII